MQPLGNVGIQSQTIETETKDAEGRVTGKTSTVTKGNTGIYQEIAKKKVSYGTAGKTVNFFEDKRQKRLTGEGGGKSYLVDNNGVSYIHWRNRHIFLDSESMMPIKLQAGEFRPSAKLWYTLYEEGLLKRLSGNASTPPAKTKNSNTTIIIIGVAMFALGYFVALTYGHQLSPALYPPTIQTSQTTSISTSLQTIISHITSTSSASTTTLPPPQG